MKRTRNAIVVVLMITAMLVIPISALAAQQNPFIAGSGDFYFEWGAIGGDFRMNLSMVPEDPLDLKPKPAVDARVLHDGVWYSGELKLYSVKDGTAVMSGEVSNPDMPMAIPLSIHLSDQGSNVQDTMILEGEELNITNGNFVVKGDYGTIIPPK